MGIFISLCGLSTFPVATACAENDSSWCNFSSLIYSLFHFAHKHGLVVMIGVFVVSVLVCRDIKHLAGGGVGVGWNKKNPKHKQPTPSGPVMQQSKQILLHCVLGLCILLKKCFVFI